ncbi:MAG: peptidase Ste24p, partial [Marmoricola sp.]|nr:peptidase Ste24p [Marmoricola sp.]
MLSAPYVPAPPSPGISSHAWEHPADRGALVALRKLRGFDTVLEALSGMYDERAVRLQLLGSGIRDDRHEHALVHDTAGALGSLKGWLDETFRRGQQVGSAPEPATSALLAGLLLPVLRPLAALAHPGSPALHLRVDVPGRRDDGWAALELSSCRDD